MPKSRWQAFATHLALSFLIFGSIILIMLFSWYPGIFFFIGGLHGIKIAAGIDLVLGPLLTAIVYNISKPIKLILLDLGIIFSIQVSALSAGIYIVFSERPLVQAIVDDGIYIHTASEYKTNNIDYKSLDKFSGRNPKIVAIDLPEDPKDAELMKDISFMVDGYPISLDTSKYTDIRSFSRTKAWLGNDFDETLNCYWLEIYSFHYSGKGCFSTDKGIIKLNRSGSESWQNMTK